MVVPFQYYPMFKLHRLLAGYAWVVRVGSGCMTSRPPHHSPAPQLSFTNKSYSKTETKKAASALTLHHDDVAMMTIIGRGPPSEDPCQHSIIRFSAHALMPYDDDCATLNWQWHGTITFTHDHVRLMVPGLGLRHFIFAAA